MITKRCFKCDRVKSIDLFYKHNQMADGHLNKCKSCTKKDVSSRVSDPRFRDKILEYDRQRSKLPHRKASLLAYQKRKRLLHRGIYKSNQKVGNAIRDGRLIPEPCIFCGSSEHIEAHHEDYRKYLKVIWMCRNDHKAYHRGELKLPF